MGRIESVLVCIMFAGMAMPVNAQPAGAPLENAILSDSPDDAQISVISGNIEPPGALGPLDLISFDIQESEEDFVFQVQMANLAPENHLPVVMEGTIVIDFRLGDSVVNIGGGADKNSAGKLIPRDIFRLEFDHGPDLPVMISGSESRAQLTKYDISREEYVPVHHVCESTECPLLVEVDYESNSLLVTIPRISLQDTNGQTPHPGLRLHEFVVSSSGTVDRASFGLASVNDVMPNDGLPAGNFIPALGAPDQIGHVLLGSSVPVRWSNGEETTYVYYISLTKTDEEPDEISLSTSELPDGWKVTLPAESMYLDGQRVIELPIVLDMPFRHVHGDYDAFFVEAHSERDSSAIGRVELGVRFSEVPQPTGHHPRLWVHGGPPNDGDSSGVGAQTTSDAFMTALNGESQPDSYDAWIYPDGGNGNPGKRPHKSWDIPLEPTFRMGFDFDLERAGQAEVEFASSTDVEGAMISGSLFYRSTDRDPNDRGNDYAKELATFRGLDAKDMVAGEPTKFTADIWAKHAGDYVPARPEGAYVFMRVELYYEPNDAVDNFFEPTSLYLVPGSTFDLPLNEFVDDIELFYHPINDIELSVIGPELQNVNSGEAALFNLKIDNSGVVNERFSLRAIGPYGNWSSVVGDTIVEVPSNSQLEFSVLLGADPNSLQGQRSGVLVEAVSQTDPLARAEARIFIMVDETVDHEDFAYLQPDSIGLGEASKGAPVGQLIAPSSIILALALIRAKRRI